MSLIFPIITNRQSGSLQEFISFWSKLYVYDNAVLYERIHNTTLSEDDLKDLYKWKNGMKLSQAKEKSLNTKIISKIEIVNKLYDSGNYIIIDSARGSGTGKYWTKATADQLQRWGVRYHKVRCGHKFAADHYIDDKALSDIDFFKNIV